jgi:DNA processing protein
MEADIKYLSALNHFPKFGPVRLKKLKKYFLSWENAFRAGLKELIAAGLEEGVANEFAAARININPQEILEKMAKENIKIAGFDDKLYPKLLKEIYDPPQIIYYKGSLLKNDDFCLAVVGTRKFSAYGERVTGQIVKDLARNNLTIVSGLAIGIDALAHNATLEAGGRTIAVLGSGLYKYNIYPSSNRYLADKIINSGGAVISELAPTTPPLRFNFPQRNRIISGLSLGTLVIEAGEKSGSLITAQFSLDQNRDVFSVPGSIYSLVSAGANKLIKQGAKLVSSAADIIEALNLTQIKAFVETKKAVPESKEEGAILKFIKEEPIHINDLVRLTDLDTSAINSTLLIMEMKGMVKNLGNMLYIRI